MDAEADREESWVRKQMQQHPGLAEEARPPRPPPPPPLPSTHPQHLLPYPHVHARAYAHQDARALYECSESPDVYAMDEGG